MDHLETLRSYLGARYSPDTIRSFVLQAKYFLDDTGPKDRYSKEDILAYVDHLLTKGRKRRTITTALDGIRALFRARGWPWPFAPRELHLPSQESTPPTTPPEDIAKLILAVRGGPMPARGAVALATIYGLRANEIVKVLGKGLRGQVLEVQTSKGGRRRVHQIPPQLTQTLTFAPIEITRAGMQLLFDHLMVTHVREPRYWEGWHSLRRALVTGLLQGGVDLYTLYRWMGWHITQTAFIYYHPNPESLDKQIYARHPLLLYW